MRFSNHALLTLLAAALLSAACTQEVAGPDLASPAKLTLRLGTESPEATRVTYVGDQTFTWTAGDVVGAYMYSTTKKNVPGSYGVDGEYGPWIAPFNLTGGAGTGNGEFSFEILYPENGEAVGHVAMYPYVDQEYIDIYDGETLVQTLHYKSSFDPQSGNMVFCLPRYWRNLPDLSGVRMPMLANLDGASPTVFKHVGAAVKVTLKNVPADARYFKLTADKNISGEFVINQSEIGTGVLHGDGASNMVELQLAEGAGKYLESVDIYFPVPAGTYTFGLGIYGDGKVILEKQGSTSNTLGRGTILRLPAVDLNGSSSGGGGGGGGTNTGIGEYDPNLASASKLSGLTYQMNVFSFADSDGDGIGDFQGVIDHLDYLDALGVTAIWLSPIHPAQSYHGYDVTDYDSIDPRYGTKKTFKKLVKAAHERNMRIYLDYVINHSGNEHTWFQDCKKYGPDSPYWGYYAFSKNPQEDCYAGRIDQIPQGWYDTGKWFPVTITSTGETYYYYSEFGTGMFSDYNYWHGNNCEQSPAFQAVVQAISTWLECGVDGLRLDAVKHIYADEAGQENIQFWQKFYSTVNSYYGTYAEFREDLTGKADPNIFMVGEVLSGEDVCRPFYAGLPTVFDFQYWWTLRESLNNEGNNGFTGGMCDRFYRHRDVRADAIYTPKLSNHDEDRTATNLGRYMPKIRLAATVLLTSPGRPFIYQGEELGYWGNKSGGDEYVRTPILWTPNITSAALNGVYGKYDADMLQAPIDVLSQEEDAGSLLMLYRRFAYARNINPALADGDPEYDEKTSGDNSVMCWYLHANDGSGKQVLVMHNVSRYSHTVERWPGDNLSTVLVASEPVLVNGNQVTMPPYSSVVFALN